MSYTEVRNLPIQYRRWFIRRLVKHFDKKAAAVSPNAKKKINNLEENNQDKDVENIEKFFAKFK